MNINFSHQRHMSVNATHFRSHSKISQLNASMRAS